LRIFSEQENANFSYQLFRTFEKLIFFNIDVIFVADTQQIDSEQTTKSARFVFQSEME